MATPLNTLKQAKCDNDLAVAKLKDEGRKILALDAGTRTPVQTARLDAIDREINALVAESVTIARDLAEAQRQANADLQSVADADHNTQRPAAGAKWEQMFPADARSLEGWESPSEYFKVVGKGLHDPRLQASSMTTTSGSGGGFAVPSGILGPWWNDALENQIIVPRATIWPMATEERKVPAWDIRNRASNIGGLSIQWTPETGTIDYQVGKIRLVQLRAKKGAMLLEGSNELLDDGLDMAGQINKGLVLALNYGLDGSFFFGAGGNQPLGILNAACGATIVCSKEGGQTASTITYNNLTGMFSRLSPGSLSGSVWIAHPSTIPQLSTLTVAVGSGGSVIPVMTSGSGQFTILTRPVIFSEKLNPLGQKGDIVLADFSQYFVGLRKDAAIDRSSHVGFTRDTETFRLTLRIDGQPAVDTPFQPPNSAPTLSPFVTLEARS